jgi:hypothetical protein
MTTKFCYKLTLTASGEEVAGLPEKKRTIYSILDGCRNNGHRLNYGEHEPHEEFLKGRKFVTAYISVTCREKELPEDIQQELGKHCSIA